MESSSKFLLLTILSSILMIFSSVECARTKLRSMDLVIKEVNAIKEVLANASEDGTLQWKPSPHMKFALVDESLFPLGLKDESPKTRAAAPKRAPSNRRPPKNPKDGKSPSGKIKMPRTYNAREVWGEKCPSFNHVIEQGGCNNCWAAAIISMLNDRICMYQEDGEPQKFYSIKDLTTCSRDKCKNGLVQEGLEMWVDANRGLVTGGDTRLNQPPGCKPAPENSTTMNFTECATVCDDNEPYSDGDVSVGGARYEIKSRKMEEIMVEIYLYGPVIATMDVHEGFARYYAGGVYKLAKPDFKGRHAVKLYGWGTQNGIPFWYGTNSWGPHRWGEDGFFKIQRGSNECKIEEYVHAALPQEALF